MKSKLRDEIQGAASAHPPRISLELYPPILDRGIVFTRDTKMGKNPTFHLFISLSARRKASGPERIVLWDSR